MCMSSLSVKSNIKNYDVFFCKNIEFIKKIILLQNIVFIIDENVWNLYKKNSLKNIPVDKVIVQKVSEDCKNIDTVCELYEKIMAFAPRKNLNLISIGGGIIQDITGFVASSLYRGVNWIFIPTTLLAQVDSCIGAKTSLNFRKFKNLVGTFYPPSQIYVYPEFLKTLTKEDYYSGVGEMAKFHIMSGEEETIRFVKFLTTVSEIDNFTMLATIKKCLKIKKSYIEEDEFDTDKRNMLNYGHCIGHAIENSTNFAVPHGQAIVYGMLFANKEACNRGLLNSDTEEFLREKVLKPILISTLPKIDINQTIAAMRQDKKNLGEGLALVMLTDNYAMTKITDMTVLEIQQLLQNGYD